MTFLLDLSVVNHLILIQTVIVIGKAATVRWVWASHRWTKLFLSHWQAQISSQTRSSGC